LENNMHVYQRIARRLPVILTATAFALAGCGGGGGGEATPTSSPKSPPTASPQPTPTTSAKSGAASSILSLQANASQLKFDKSTLSAKPGKVKIEMKNPSALQHNVALEGNGVGVAGKVVGQGGTSKVTATLKAGTYTFYCSVDSHRQAGMEGTLTVK